MSVVENLVTRFTADTGDYDAGAKRVVASTGMVQGALQRLSGNAGFGGFGDSARFALSELDSGTPILGELVSVVKAAGIAFVGATAAIGAFALYAMKTAGDAEALRLGIAAFAGSAGEAERQMRRLQEVARLPGLGLDEAAQGSAALQAVGFDSRLAERALMGFGNALALVGRGKDELQGVIVALSQIVSKGAVSAEEINQIAERVPQIRTLMKTAFGTADTETLAKRVGPQEFIFGIIGALSTLPQATGGAKNAFENFGDTAIRIVGQIGQGINDLLLPGMNRVADFGDFLAQGGFFGGVVDRWAASLSKIGPMAKNAARGIAEMGRGAADSLSWLIGDEVARGLNSIANGFAVPLEFLAGAKDLPDGLVRGAAVLAAAVEAIPDMVGLALDLIRTNASAIGDFVNGVITAINAVIRTLTGGFKIDFTGPMGAKVSAEVKSSMFLKEIPTIGLGPGFGANDEQRARASEIAGGIGGRAQELYGGFGDYRPSNEVASDASPGGFTSPESRALSSIARATQATAENTGRQLDLQRVAIGGGEAARVGVTPVEVARLARGGGGNLRGLLDQVADAIGREMAATYRQGRLSDARAGY